MRCIGCLWLSSAILVDDQHRSREITRQPYGWPRNYVNIFSEISIGQWLCFSHMASFRSYGLGMWVYTTHKHCWAKISAWQAEHTLGTEDSVAKSPSYLPSQMGRRCLSCTCVYVSPSQAEMEMWWGYIHRINHIIFLCSIPEIRLGNYLSVHGLSASWQRG